MLHLAVIYNNRTWRVAFRASVFVVGGHAGPGGSRTDSEEGWTRPPPVVNIFTSSVWTHGLFSIEKGSICLCVVCSAWDTFVLMSYIHPCQYFNGVL